MARCRSTRSPPSRGRSTWCSSAVSARATSTQLDAALAGGELYEYWAHIVPTSDYGIHRETMRRYPRGDAARSRYVREWLAANAAFRRYVLRELRRRGPLRSRDLEDRAAVPWKTGGWNDGKGVGRMLDILWFGGEITIVGREGNERIWDLAARHLPRAEPRWPAREIARAFVERGLRRKGIARRGEFGRTFDGVPPGADTAWRALVREGVAVPVRVSGLVGEWWAHRDVLEQDPGRPRTVLLSPFDRLVYDRERTLELFGFAYRLEMYVPPAKREYGYYVLPILHGTELIGRIEPVFDRRARVLRINGVWIEPGAPGTAGVAVRGAIDELAGWLGAESGFGPPAAADLPRRAVRLDGPDPRHDAPGGDLRQDRRLREAVDGGDPRRPDDELRRPPPRRGGDGDLRRLRQPAVRVPRGRPGEGAADGPGDYVFVPPYTPHREENPSPDTPAVVVIARSTQEGIVVNLPSLWARGGAVVSTETVTGLLARPRCGAGEDLGPRRARGRRRGSCPRHRVGGRRTRRRGPATSSPRSS